MSMNSLRAVIASWLILGGSFHGFGQRLDDYQDTKELTVSDLEMILTLAILCS